MPKGESEDTKRVIRRYQDHHCLNFIFINIHLGIVGYVDSDGIVHHHCLNVLFIITANKYMKYMQKWH
jgi:hypothetical protein